MTAPEQKTLASEVALEGIGVHTGEPTRVVVGPAKPNTGIRFRRIDLERSPEIPASVENVVSTERCTTLGHGEAKVLTVEHLLAAVMALELDNLRVDVEGPELPIGDGSFRPFFDALRSAGTVGQGKAARVLELRKAVSVECGDGTSYVAAPAAALRVSATIDFDHPVVGRQFASFDITEKAFGREIAEARTFGFLRDVESLLGRGLVRGASMENTIVLDEAGVANGDLRFPDEFVRHKIGDVVGDMALLGRRLRAHIVAERPNHTGSVELVKAVEEAAQTDEVRPVVDIQKILQYLPHRYPMLLVDRIVDFEVGKRIVGVKNVTFNEPFFQGHYPGHPIMPGVLIIEAMAQVGGLLLLDAIEKPEEKVLYIMSMDKVKWRRPVIPGDQLRFEVELLQLRRHVCKVRGKGMVDGHLVAEAEMMARIVDR